MTDEQFINYLVRESERLVADIESLLSLLKEQKDEVSTSIYQLVHPILDGFKNSLQAEDLDKFTYRVNDLNHKVQLAINELNKIENPDDLVNTLKKDLLAIIDFFNNIFDLFEDNYEE